MKILTQLSGGLDSVAVLAELVRLKKHAEIYPLFVDYGQPYCEKEFSAASYAVRHFQQTMFAEAAEKQSAEPVVVVYSLKRLELPLEVQSTTEVKEYIPYRNLVISAACFNIAAAWGCEEIATGSKSVTWRPGDLFSFKDSTFDFYAALNRAAAEATEPGSPIIRIKMPIAGWPKERVLITCMEAGLDVKKLWSCYEAGPEPCGECYHCKEIEKAYHSRDVQAYMHKKVAS